MLLFEHKQHMQSYNAQSLKQRDILSFKEIGFKGLQQMAGRYYTTLLPC